MPSQPKSRAPKRKAPSHDLRDTISTEHREESQRRPEDLPTRTQEESTQGTAPTHTVSEKYPEKLHKPSTSECAKALSPALSDVYQDELYNPLLAAPARPQHALSSKMAVLHDRLQAAQRSHATLTPKSLDDESFVTAALIRQREKVESDFREFANHVPKPPSSPPPRTISPKEVALDYNETEEDADMPLFPQDNGGHESSLPSSTHRSQPYRPWTVLAGLSVEEYLLALAEGLQERLSNDNTLSIARSHLRLFRDDFCAKLLSLAMEKSTRIIQAGKSYINGESFCLRCSGCARFIKATTYLCSTCSDGYYNLCPTCQLGNGPRDPRGHLLTRLDHDFEATAPSVTDAWEYIVESFASKNDAINFMGVVHCWELILPWLKRGYMLSRPLINWSIARGSYLNLESDKAHGEAKDYSRAATDPLSHEILLSVSSKTGATPRSNLRQESETIDKDVENFDPFRYNMQTIMLGTASPGRPASPTKGFHLGAPPKQASLGSEQSNLRILSTVAHWEKMAEKDRQFSSGQLSEERSIQPFKTGSPYARDASTPTPVPRGNSPETTTQPSASSASSHAKVDDISRLIDDHQATLHDKKDPSNQQHQLSNLSPGTSRNSSTAPSEPSVDAASHQKNSSLRDRSQQIDLLDRSSPNHDPIPRDRASNPLSETPLIDWGLADRDLPARRSSEEPFFTTGRTPFFSKLRWDHERPKALDKENYYTSPIAIALSSLPASLRQRPIDMFYFRFFTDNTARLLVSHDCDSNPFRSVLPRSTCAPREDLLINSPNGPAVMAD